MNLRFTILLLLLTATLVYATKRKVESPKGAETRASWGEKVLGSTLPPLPPGYVQPKSGVSSLVILPPPRQARVTLAWNNVTNGVIATNYYAILEASTNLTRWVEVARLPFQFAHIITLTNRPRYEFYRAGVTHK
jgi:hypothetical protein